MADAAGRSLELLVADTPEEATELLRTEPNISVLVDAVEMGAPTRWCDPRHKVVLLSPCDLQTFQHLKCCKT